jgi:hypothetical protein
MQLSNWYYTVKIVKIQIALESYKNIVTGSMSTSGEELEDARGDPMELDRPNTTAVDEGILDDVDDDAGGDVGGDNNRVDNDGTDDNRGGANDMGNTSTETDIPQDPAATSTPKGQSISTASSYGSCAEKEDMGPSFNRCKAARTAKLMHKSICCTTKEKLGKADMRKHSRIGNLENWNDPILAKTFRGSRINNKEMTVNQSITMSFEPVTMTCLVCDKAHHIHM